MVDATRVGTVILRDTQPNVQQQPAPTPASYKASHGILSGQDLMDAMKGAPKTDVKIFGKTIKTNSAAYKDTLRDLQNYQQKVDGLKGTPLENISQNDMDQLKDHLQHVIDGADAYLLKHANAGGKSGRRDVMTELKQMATDERGRLDQLDRGDLKNTAGKNVSVGDGLALLRGGVTDASAFNKALNDSIIDQTNSKANFGSGAVNSVDLVAYGTDTRVVKPLNKSTPELKPGESGIGMDKNDMRVAARNLATATIAKFFGMESAIPKPDIVVHNGQAGLAMKKAPGESLVHKYHVGNVPDNDKKEYERSEIQLQDLRANRNEAGARDLEKAMKQSMLERDENNDIVRIRTRMKDMPIESATNKALAASIQQGLMDLQGLHCLLGQVDAQPENIFIQIRGNTALVSGIDQDMCLGEDFKSLIDLKDDGKTKRYGTNYGGPPPLMSRAFYDKLMTLKNSEDAIRTMCGSQISDGEKTTEVGRLKAMIAHAETLQSQGRIVDNFETWTDRTTGKTTVDFLKSADSNYVRRGIESIAKGANNNNLEPLDNKKHV